MKAENEQNQLVQQLSAQEQERVINALRQAYGAVKRIFPEDIEGQEKSVNEVLEGLQKPVVEEYDENGFQKCYRLNIYTDSEDLVMITVDVNFGKSALIVKHHETGRMLKSLCYLVPQDIVPTHEWYRPTMEEHKLLPRDMREHVSNGGLMLRKIGQSFKTTFKQQIRKMTNKNFN